MDKIPNERVAVLGGMGQSTAMESLAKRTPAGVATTTKLYNDFNRWDIFI